MGRTQIYLSDAELELLDRAARTSGASRSELVRRAIQAIFGEHTPEQKLAALRASSGSWADRGFTGAQYVDAIRGDLNERLRPLERE